MHGFVSSKSESDVVGVVALHVQCDGASNFWSVVSCLDWVVGVVVGGGSGEVSASWGPCLLLRASRHVSHE